MSPLRTPVPEAVSDDEEAPSTQRARATLPEDPAPIGPDQPATPGSPEADFKPEEARASRSGRRASRRAAGREDTLLSLPAPAERHELEIADRLDDLERRLDDLADRVRVIEALPRSSTDKAGSHTWLIWLVFLVVLGVSWQLFRAGR